MQQHPAAADADFRVDILVGVGPSARLHSLPMPKFTLAGTSRTAPFEPLAGKLKLTFTLSGYTPEEMRLIVKRTAKMLGIDL